MFINKSETGLNNVCGKNIAKYRILLKISQRELADRLQLAGLDVDKMQFSGLNVVKGL